MPNKVLDREEKLKALLDAIEEETKTIEQNISGEKGKQKFIEDKNKILEYIKNENQLYSNLETKEIRKVIGLRELGHNESDPYNPADLWQELLTAINNKINFVPNRPKSTRKTPDAQLYNYYISPESYERPLGEAKRELIAHYSTGVKGLVRKAGEQARRFFGEGTKQERLLRKTIKEEVKKTIKKKFR